MGIPQITDRIRSAPAQALRSVFAGIGRILLAADRQLEQAAPAISRPSGDGRDRQRARSRQRSDGQAVLAESRWRSLDETGNVRLLSAEDLGDDYDGYLRPTRPTQVAPVGPVELPLPGYDTLSLASIRARLRGLNADQLRLLINYELSHAERPEVLGMFERRIEKLETGG